MIVFTRIKDDTGIVFEGTLEECHTYTDTHDMRVYDTVSIDYDDGRIYERIYPVREVVEHG